MLCAASTASAAVHVNPLFTDHAVLQRDQPVPVWGTADAGEPVVVTFAGRSIETTADDAGRWTASLPPMPASDQPGTLTVTGRPADPTFTATDILVGDVWICSGQSNMWRPLAPRAGQVPVDRYQQELAAADHPTIRLLTVATTGSFTPVTEAKVGPGWQACSPATAGDFSAVGYFFGRDLQADVKVPIGLIHSSVGGTVAAAWTSREALSSSGEFRAIVAQLDRARAAATRPTPSPAKGRPTTKPAVAAPNRQGGPTTLFNGMIAPLVPYGIRGVAWYQGESDANPVAHAIAYRRLLPLLVTDWRSRWRQGDFPFLVVQVAPFTRTTPEIRDSQRAAVSKLVNAALVVTTDVGVADDIHPSHKAAVGARLALAARAVGYGEPVEFSGPAFKDVAFAGPDATVTFDHVGKGLVARDGELRGFEVAGADGTFAPATATIHGDTVVVHAAGVTDPKAVRFGWANVPDVNLFNADGLPASPFTSVTLK